MPIKSKKDALGYFTIEETATRLIIQADDDFYVLIISGERNRLDFESIKKSLACTTIMMVNKQEIFENFALEAGQILWVDNDLPCIIDNWIFKHTFVYGWTAGCCQALKIAPDDLVKANNVVLRFD